MNPELLLRALHLLLQDTWPGSDCIAETPGRTFPTVQCHACPPCSCHTALRIPLLLLLHQHSSQGFTQDVWTCYTALSTWSTDLTTMSSQTGLWQIHISYLPRKDQPESGYIHITFPCKLWCVQKRPFKMTGSSPWTALGTCSFHHLQRLLGHSWHSRSGLWCDICSQAERQREKVSLAEVPWEDSSWAEPTARTAAHIYINKSSTCSY